MGSIDLLAPGRGSLGCCQKGSVVSVKATLADPSNVDSYIYFRYVRFQCWGSNSGLHTGKLTIDRLQPNTNRAIDVKSQGTLLPTHTLVQISGDSFPRQMCESTVHLQVVSSYRWTDSPQRAGSRHQEGVNPAPRVPRFGFGRQDSRTENSVSQSLPLF